MDGLATELRRAREAAADPFAAAVAAELHGIGMGEGEFRAELAESDLGATGADKVAFLIRPNRGPSVRPVAETASGGELSRIALAIAAVGGGHTMIFDEIDAGVGGQTAHAVGATLQRLAERAQVITITHLPQIASLADGHFRVEKVPGDPTHTTIDQLDAGSGGTSSNVCSAARSSSRPCDDDRAPHRRTLSSSRGQRGSTGARSTSSAGWGRTTSPSSTTPISTACRRRSCSSPEFASSSTLRNRRPGAFRTPAR